MSNYNKIRESLVKTSSTKLILIPHRIQHQCIAVARTIRARQRLVDLVRFSTHEEYRRLFTPSHKPWENQKSGMQVLSMWSRLKNWFRGLWV